MLCCHGSRHLSLIWLKRPNSARVIVNAETAAKGAAVIDGEGPWHVADVEALRRGQALHRGLAPGGRRLRSKAAQPNRRCVAAKERKHAPLSRHAWTRAAVSKPQQSNASAAAANRMPWHARELRRAHPPQVARTASCNSVHRLRPRRRHRGAVGQCETGGRHFDARARGWTMLPRGLLKRRAANRVANHRIYSTCLTSFVCIRRTWFETAAALEFARFAGCH